MSDIPEDVYGKIDALLGKRAGFGASSPKVEVEDFPILTEVVTRDDEASNVPPPAPVVLPAAAAMLAEPFGPEPGEVPTDLPDLGIIPPVCDFDLLDQFPVDPMEERLLEMIAHQQAQLEAMIRRVVREELERFLRGQ